MAEAQPNIPDPLELAVEQAIAVCDGDLKGALRAALVYNDFLERKLDTMRSMVSTGYARQRVTPTRKAAEKVEEWRDIAGDKNV